MGLMTGYEFNMGEFLAQEIQDRAVGREKILLAYPCMITQMCFTVGVQELPGIDELIELTNTTDLGLIRDTINPMAKQAKKEMK